MFVCLTAMLICFEFLFVLFAEGRQVFGAHFFFSLDHKLDVAGQGLGLHHGLEGLEVHVHLTLVVAGAPRKDGAFGVPLGFFDDGVEGPRFPQLDGVGGLDVVVAVDQDGGQCRVDDFFAVYDGVALGGAAFSLVGYGLEGGLRHELGGCLDVLLVGRIGTDRGNAQEVQQFFQKAIAVLGDIILYILTFCITCIHLYRNDAVQYNNN